MKYAYIALTDEGKRQLLRDLTYELSDKKIAELADQFADSVKIDSTGEAYIKIDRANVLCCAVKMYTHYIDANHIETVTCNEDDYDE